MCCWYNVFRCVCAARRISPPFILRTLYECISCFDSCVAAVVCCLYLLIFYATCHWLRACFCCIQPCPHSFVNIWMWWFFEFVYWSQLYVDLSWCPRSYCAAGMQCVPPSFMFIHFVAAVYLSSRSLQGATNHINSTNLFESSAQLYIRAQARARMRQVIIEGTTSGCYVRIVIRTPRGVNNNNKMNNNNILTPPADRCCFLLLSSSHSHCTTVYNNRKRCFAPIRTDRAARPLVVRKLHSAEISQPHV